MKFDEIKVGDVATTFFGKNFLVVERDEEQKEILLSVPEELGGWVHPDTVYKNPSMWFSPMDIVATINDDIKIGDKIKITNRNALFPGLNSKRAKELMLMEHTVLSLKDGGNTVIIPMSREDGGHTFFSKEPGRAIKKENLIKVENSVKNSENKTKVKIGDKVKVSAGAELPHKISSSPLMKTEFLAKEHEVIEVYPSFGTLKIKVDTKDGGHFLNSKDPGWILHQNEVTIMPEKSDSSSEIKAGDTIVYNDDCTTSTLNGKKYTVLKVVEEHHGKTFLLAVPPEDGGYHHPRFEFLQPTWLAASSAVKKCIPETKMKKVKLKHPEYYPFKLDTPKSIKDGTFTVLDENYTDVYNSILIEVPKEYGGVFRSRYEKHSFYVLKENAEFIEDENESSEKMKKEPKYQVLDAVFLPKRHKDKLPEEVFNSRRGNEFYEFTICYQKANSTDVDYFVSISESDGGKWEKSISRSGRWINEKFLLSREEMEAEKKKNQPNQPLVEIVEMKLSEKEITKMDHHNTTKHSATIVTTAQYDELMKETRTFSALLPPMVEFGKTAIRWAVHTACKALGKSAEFFTGAMMLVEDFLKNNANIANNAMQWILGFLAKNVHHLRKIPGIKDLKWFEFLEREDIQRFGMFAEASSEGNVLGDFATKVWHFVQQWIFGSAIATQIAEAASSTEGLMRLLGEMDSGMKTRIAEGLSESALRENEAHREAVAIDEMKGMKTASAVA